MVDLPLTFQAKSELGSATTKGANNPDVEPSTCIAAEPYALQVLDDSMSPEFWSGCIILIDPTGRATDGSYVLAHLGTTTDDAEPESVFRQLQQQQDGTWALCALNARFPATNIGASLNGIAGVIVQRAGKRRSQHKHYNQR